MSTMIHRTLQPPPPPAFPRAPPFFYLQLNRNSGSGSSMRLLQLDTWIRGEVRSSLPVSVAGHIGTSRGATVASWLSNYWGEETFLSLTESQRHTYFHQRRWCVVKGDKCMSVSQPVPLCNTVRWTATEASSTATGCLL